MSDSFHLTGNEDHEEAELMWAEFGDRSLRMSMPPVQEKKMLSYSLRSSVDFDAREIQMQLNLGAEQVSKWLFKTREKALVEHLVSLGWTPPKEEI